MRKRSLSTWRHSLAPIVFLLTLILTLSCSGTWTQAATIYKIQVADTIDVISSEFIVQSLDKAERESVEFLLLQLSTPGGFGFAMRDIVEKVLNSKVPVVIYVAPSGARAASAGFFILLAADVAAMAPGTNTGAASPILSIGGLFPVEGGETGKTLSKKVESDAAAQIRSIASRRGRNVEKAEKAVTESKSYTEGEALEGRLIDLVAPNEADLLSQLEGRAVTRFSGQQATLRTKNASLIQLEMTTRQKFLSAISDPNLALLMGLGGLLLLYLEFSHPGLIAPGVVGGIAVLLSLLGFSFLPINYVGVLLILLAIGLFIAEVKVQGFGILGVGGIVALLIGALILVDAPNPEVGIHLSTAAGVAISFGLIMIFLLRLVIKASRRPVLTGAEGMVGWIGVAESALEPEGKVFIHGELWDAFAKVPVEPGARVQVVSVQDLRLEVQKVQE